ncbi:putative reverse transcriptase domain-containing protein [Tanacetum coccineum]|uniref:Reverse transcriptase domain-containing protein n=1 Tax=Tanacetum coccineum TaxID=301880 RepID=A0ABQ5J3Z0_9ASTR
MVSTRGSTPEFSGPAFEAAVQRAVDALLHGLTTRLTNEIRQNGAGGSGDQPPTIHSWLERFGKHKPRSFSSATTPVDAENWITHIEKIFEVLGCANEFKARLVSYKLEGVALYWWKAFKQAKGGETYVATLSWKDFRDIFFFVVLSQKEGPPEEQAKHFKWELYDWILDGIVNTKFTDMAQVASAARNMEILHKRSIMIDRVEIVIRSHGRTEVSSTTVLLGLQVTGACFTCDSTGHMARDCPKNGGNGGRGNGNNKQPAAKGQVFSLTKDQAANSSGTVLGTLFLNGHVVFVLFDTGATHSVVSVSLASPLCYLIISYRYLRL